MTARKLIARLHRDRRATSSVEYALLLAVIAIPMIFVFRVTLALMESHYAMVTFLNGWPFP